MKKKINIYFTDYSSDFVAEKDYFYLLLSAKYELVINKKNPDYLIYSCYGYDHVNYNCIKIFYTAENIRPDFNLCDYAIGFDYMSFGDRYFRFPNYARYGRQFEEITQLKSLTVEDLKKKSGFCNFVYSNAFADPTRDRFFYMLSEYKTVDSVGKHLNNMPCDAGQRYSTTWRESKVEFQKNYKFTIAFENSSAPGYTTEKIMHAFAAKTIPIYWGNPEITKEFNRKAFVNCHEYEDFSHVVERVSELDQNDKLYLDMVNEPCFVGGEIPAELSRERMFGFLESIFEQPLPQARRRPRYGTTVMYEQDARLLASAIVKKNTASLARKILRRLTIK